MINSISKRNQNSLKTVELFRKEFIKIQSISDFLFSLQFVVVFMNSMKNFDNKLLLIL